MAIKQTWRDGELISTEEIPDPPPAPPDPLTVIAAIGDALGTITPTSTSTQLRGALLAARTAIDNAIQGAMVEGSIL